MAKLVEVVLARLYPQGVLPRLFWIADSTPTEKPYAKRIASMGLFHRTKRVVGRAQPRKGHCYVFAAHLYARLPQGASKWASVLVGTLLYVKGRSIPTLVVELASPLRLPAGVRHGWLGDRGMLPRLLVRGVSRLDPFVLGRVRSTRGSPSPRAAGRVGHAVPRSLARSAGSITCSPAFPTACANRR